MPRHAGPAQRPHLHRLLRLSRVLRHHCASPPCFSGHRGKRRICRLHRFANRVDGIRRCSSRRSTNATSSATAISLAASLWPPSPTRTPTTPWPPGHTARYSQTARSSCESCSLRLPQPCSCGTTGTPAKMGTRCAWQAQRTQGCPHRAPRRSAAHAGKPLNTVRLRTGSVVSAGRDELHSQHCRIFRTNCGYASSASSGARSSVVPLSTSWNVSWSQRQMARVSARERAASER